MKKIIFLLIVFPFFSYSQKANNWQLLLNNKIVLSGKVGQLINYNVATKDLGTLKLKYTANNDWQQYNKTFILLDTLRQIIYKKNISTKKAILEISKEYFTEGDTYKPIIVYIVSKPSNAALAAQVRVRPVPLIKLIPQD